MLRTSKNVPTSKIVAKCQKKVPKNLENFENFEKSKMLRKSKMVEKCHKLLNKSKSVKNSKFFFLKIYKIWKNRKMLKKSKNRKMLQSV